jgi:hypothetical protein
MTGTERAREYWDGKTNTTLYAKGIKAELEKLGHTDVHVWWEPTGSANEMCGNSGGYMFVSDQTDIEPLGHSFTGAMEYIAKGTFEIKEVES